MKQTIDLGDAAYHYSSHKAEMNGREYRDLERKILEENSGRKKALIDRQTTCDACKERFNCFTKLSRAKQLSGINFEIAKCCVRCKNSSFKTFSWDSHEVGTCSFHNVVCHWFSVCGDFTPKKTDALTSKVLLTIERDFERKHRGQRRYCIIGEKFLGDDENESNN